MWKELIEWIKYLLTKKPIKIELPEIPKNDDNSVDPPKPQDPPPTQPGAPDLTKIKWCGKNYSGCEEVLKMNNASMDNHTIKFSPAAPANWPTKNVKVDVQGIVCLFYSTGSGIMGGKFDWLRPGQSAKGLENIHDGYQGHSFPLPSAKCWLMIVDVNERHRSDLIEVNRK